MSPDLKLKLHVFPNPPPSPYLSHYCQKLDIPPCHRGGIRHSTLQAPRGELAYVTLSTGEKIADSQFIIQWLSSSSTQSQAGVEGELDRPLTQAQHAQSRAQIAYIEELLFPSLVCAFPSAKTGQNCAEVFRPLPWGARDLLALYQKRYWVMDLYVGMGRFMREVREVLREWVLVQDILREQA